MIKAITDLKGLWITGYIPTQADFADLFDTLFAMMPQDGIWTIADSPTGSEKPSGNTLTDTSLINANPGDIIYIDNVPLQWKAKGVTFTASTGTFDFTAAAPSGGHYLQDTQLITIPFKMYNL